MSDTHFYATCWLGWARGETCDDAIKKLVNNFRTTIKQGVTNAHKNGEAGFYVWSCKVLAPIDESYSIDNFAPQGVEIQNGTHHHITYVTAKKVAYTSNYYFGEKG